METLNPDNPAAPPPPGVVPNFNGPSRGGSLISTCLVFTAIMGVFVILRLYSRMRYTKKFGSEDYVCMIAAAGAIGLTIATIISVKSGFGRHLWDYPIKTFTATYFKKVYAIQGLYSPVILLVKISLFLLYYRLFSRDQRTRILIIFGIVVNSTFYAVSFALNLYFCGPGPGHDWVQSLRDYNCVVQARTLAIVQATFNIGSDIYLLCVPIPVISGLQLSKDKRVGVLAIFMTGILAIICSILNLYYRILDQHDDDFTWAIVPVYITTVVETNVGIMCCCFPAMPPILRSIMSAVGSSRFSPCKLYSKHLFRWIRLRSSDGAPSDRTTPKMKVTLGSKLNGKGHFLTTNKVCPKDSIDANSLELTLRGDDINMHSAERGWDTESGHAAKLEGSRLSRYAHDLSQG